jgi:hypothetical protein
MHCATMNAGNNFFPGPEEKITMKIGSLHCVRIHVSLYSGVFEI